MNRVVTRLFFTSWLALLGVSGTGLAGDASSIPVSNTNALRFVAAGPQEFRFDTGVLRGALHAGGKSLGLTSVEHIPSGLRLDRSNGLLSHYRVFTRGKRYGGGAWDWPSQGALLADGAVEVRWPAGPDRPFAMRAVYRWRSPETVDLETIVTAEKGLRGFESFLASYFNEGFTNLAVYATPSEPEGRDGFVPVRSGAGPWQMFPREEAMLEVIGDGRWGLEPNPVDWTVRPKYALPLAYRRNPIAGVSAVLMSSRAGCFAVAGPQETEGHYSLYFSLFGSDLKAGQTASARVRLVITTATEPDELLQFYHRFEGP